MVKYPIVSNMVKLSSRQGRPLVPGQQSTAQPANELRIQPGGQCPNIKNKVAYPGKRR